MKRSVQRGRISRRRIGGRRRTTGARSEGYGRKATTSTTVGVSISGNQGITFTPEQLLRKYFQDPRMIRINGYRIRITILDIQQPFLQYQAYCVTDNIEGPFVCMTQPLQITTNKSTQNVRIARDRSFWIESSDDVHKVLDIKFLAFSDTKVIIEITTYFNIEQDDVTPLSNIIWRKPEETKNKEYELIDAQTTTIPAQTGPFQRLFSPVPMKK